MNKIAATIIAMFLALYPTYSFCEEGFQVSLYSVKDDEKAITMTIPVEIAKIIATEGLTVDQVSYLLSVIRPDLTGTLYRLEKLFFDINTNCWVIIIKPIKLI
jgi:hypothetical protein